MRSILILLYDLVKTMLSGSNKAEDEEVNQSQSDSVILLPRRPVSLTHNSTKAQK